MPQQQLLAFHNSQELKDEIISRLEQHQRLDEIIHGIYWENGKGCAVGCTIHSSNHKDYERILGIPEWVAHLEDTLFEGMEEKLAKLFPLKLIKAIPVGFSNWNSLYHKLCAYILTDICRNIDHHTVKQAIADIITHHKNEEKDEKKWSAAYYRISEKLIELFLEIQK